MPTSAVERAVRVARRRLAAQLFLDSLTRTLALALGLAIVFLLLEPGQWWGVAALAVVATVLAVIHTIRGYPARFTAALEVDSRFKLHERITASLEQHGTQPATPVSQAVVADAETHAARLHIREKFPLRLHRSARLLPLFAGILAILAFVWNPVVDSSLFADSGKKPGDTKKKISDNPLSPQTPFAQPKPNVPKPDEPNAQKLAAIRAELDRLEREAKAKKTDQKWVAELTAAEDSARSFERESLDRLARMEAQLKQLDGLANNPEFKDTPAAEVAKNLAQGDLDKAKNALEELAKQAAANPNDPELKKQIETLKEEIKKAGENAAAREKLEKLIEQAKKDGRDASGLEQELERLKAEQSQPLKELAEKLEKAEMDLEKGKGAEAAKDLEDAAKAIEAIKKDAQIAEDAQGEAQRAGELRAQAQMLGEGEGKGDDPAGDVPNAKGGGQASGERPKGKDGETGIRNVRVRVPFVDPKGAKTPAGSGNFGNNFTKTDPGKLGPAIQDAARSAPAATAGQPLTPADRAAVREFFERLGK